MTFLDDIGLRPLSFSKQVNFEPIGLALGAGAYALEIAVVRSDVRPSTTDMRAAWNVRLNSRPVPLLLVALYDNEMKAAVCGPSGQNPPVYHDLEPAQVERLCLTALQEPDRHSVYNFLQNLLPEVGSNIPGLLNEGLLATHELENGVPLRDDWRNAVERSRHMLNRRDRPLLESLGYEIHSIPGPVSVLVAEDTKIAIGLFLDRSEAIDIPNERFSNLSPIAYALARADKERLPYVVALSDGMLRLYPVEAGVGVGQRGRTETFLQLHLDLLTEDKSGYLWLLFSSSALAPKGTFEQILADSANYSADLGGRLRERIYSEVIPQLAQAIARARKLDNPDNDALDATYQMALTLLFRLLFIAYAEDKGLLPYRTNEAFKARSLKQKARELLKMEQQNAHFDTRSTLWDEINGLFEAIDKGDKRLGIPPYNGGLFASDTNTSPIGAALAAISLTDEQFGPALRDLMCEDSPDGGLGAVDFRSLSVREFGTIYEGLLQSELSIAQTDLGLDNEGLYVPVTDPKRVIVPAGMIYLHNASGARKSTGSYYTKSFAVEHLLNHALEPALDDHIARLNKLLEEQNTRAAGEAFFDFRVADIAMGSGHFLVAAIDRIERRLSTYLAEHALTDVTDELTRLRERAKEVIEQYSGRLEVEDTLLLRRQIARRCIYGVDMNPMAVELARLSIWIHTFVPGLPLSLLDYNLVRGNSLVGIATLDEAKDVLAKDSPLFSLSAEQLLGSARDALAKLGQLADADASEISQAREAYDKARKALAPTAALFDILTGSRINGELKRQIDTGQATHWVKDEILRELPNSGLRKLAIDALEATPPFHFPVAFPQVFLRDKSGFDVLLGNPPWEKLHVEEHEFWARYSEGLRGLSQEKREKIIPELRQHRLDLLELFNKEIESTRIQREVILKGPYPGIGSGHPDLYKAFTWRFWYLTVNGTGRIGVVLPRAALSSKGGGEFRKEIVSRGVISDLTFLLNSRGWAFDDAEPRYTIGLVSLKRQQPPDNAKLPARGPYRNLPDFMEGVSSDPILISISDMLTWDDDATFPLLPSELSLPIFLKMRLQPRLDKDDKSSWRVKALQGDVNASTSKREKVIEFPDETSSANGSYWTVYKGASFNLWQPDTGEHYAKTRPEIILPYLQSKRISSYRYQASIFREFSQSWIENPATLPCRFPRIAFRDTARATDTRTTLVSLVPPDVILAHQAPYLVRTRGDEKDEAYVLGILSSLPLDWYARCYVETHMSFYIIEPFPVPRPTRDNPLWLRVVGLAGRLAAVDERYAEWADAVGVKYGALKSDEKDDMIHELDAVVAHLYDLNENQLTHIFETFHEGWDYRHRLDAVLKHYKNWSNRL